MRNVPTDLVARILEFVRREVPGAPADLTIDTPLATSGLLDSVALVRLAALVERETGLIIPDRDVTADHFDSVRRIQEYVTARKREA
jgi:acyl carrier protein